MMTIKPQLPNHLIRELMHTIRQKHGGDAMVLLALCGKTHFPVFEYVVETRIYASADKDAISLHSLPVVRKSVPLEFLTEASKRLTMRFVRELAVMYPSPDRLPFDQITELTIHKFNKLFIPVVNSWTNLDIFTILFISDYNSDNFINAVNSGTVLLTNTRNLNIGMSVHSCVKFLASIPCLALPEDVLFNIIDAFEVPFDLASLKTFPSVKRFSAKIYFCTGMNSEKLHRVSAIIKCFPNLETLKIDFDYNHFPRPNDFTVTSNFHEWLANTNFSTPVDITCEERVDFGKEPEPFSDELKSIGYEEDGDPSKCVIKKVYGNVKLVHRIHHNGYSGLAELEIELPL